MCMNIISSVLKKETVLRFNIKKKLNSSFNIFFLIWLTICQHKHLLKHLRLLITNLNKFKAWVFCVLHILHIDQFFFLFFFYLHRSINMLGWLRGQGRQGGLGLIQSSLGGVWGRRRFTSTSPDLRRWTDGGEIALFEKDVQFISVDIGEREKER